MNNTERDELFELWSRHGSSYESDSSEGYELADAILAAGWMSPNAHEGEIPWEFFAKHAGWTPPS